MRKTILVIAALATTTFAVNAFAQANLVNRPQVSNAAARKMVDACLAFAEKNNILVGVAVVGIDGTLLDFHAMQGGGPTMSETAILKAKTRCTGSARPGCWKRMSPRNAIRLPSGSMTFPKRARFPS